MKTNDKLESTVFVIFGGAGDLTWRKLVPALFDLSQDRSLPTQFAIIAVDRAKSSDNVLRRRLHDGVNVMKSDATLFMRADQVEAAWQLLMPVVEAWQVTAPSDFPNYDAGTWGPENTQGLLAPGHRWPLPTELVGRVRKKGKNS